MAPCTLVYNEEQFSMDRKHRTYRGCDPGTERGSVRGKSENWAVLQCRLKKSWSLFLFSVSYENGVPARNPTPSPKLLALIRDYLPADTPLRNRRVGE